ncbi:MAG: hypothetical protein HQL32_12095 [Planctomycetes bacterium]|nr:hypothetical protein [Planctomycetota bacterium]
MSSFNFPDFLKLQARHTEEGPWVDVHLTTYEPISTDKVRLSYFLPDGRCPGIVEMTPGELCSDKGTIRFINKDRA